MADIDALSKGLEQLQFQSQDGHGGKEAIFHEKQSWQFCLIHSVNNLLQRKEFVKKDFDAIAKDLSPNKLWNPHKSILGTGNYDVNVLASSLGRVGMTMRWFDKRKGVDAIGFDDPNVAGLILNRYEKRLLLLNTFHWLCLRKIGDTWYNLDSKLSQPQPYASLQALKEHINQVLVENGNLFVVTYLPPNKKAPDAASKHKESTDSKNSVSGTSAAPSKSKSSSSASSSNEACKKSSTLSKNQASTTSPNGVPGAPSDAPSLSLSRPAAQLAPQPSLKRKRPPTADAPPSSPKRPETLHSLSRNAAASSSSCDAPLSTDSSDHHAHPIANENTENSLSASSHTLKKPRNGRNPSTELSLLTAEAPSTLSRKPTLSPEARKARAETLKVNAIRKVSGDIERSRSRSRSEIRSRVSNDGQPLSPIDTNVLLPPSRSPKPSSGDDEDATRSRQGDVASAPDDSLSTHDKIVTSLSLQTSAPPISSPAGASSAARTRGDSSAMSIGNETPPAKFPSSALHSRNASITGMSDVSDFSPAVSPRVPNLSMSRVSSNDPMEESKANSATSSSLAAHRGSRSLRHELPPPTQVLQKNAAGGGEKLVANGVAFKHGHRRNTSNMSDISDSFAPDDLHR